MCSYLSIVQPAANLTHFFSLIDPAKDLKPKTQTAGLPRPIPADDLRVLDRAIKALDRDASEQLIFTILRKTGMRADEVLSLNIEQSYRYFVRRKEVSVLIS